MSAAILETNGWSRSQWGGALSLIVVLHGLGLFIFSERETAPPPATPRLSNTRFVNDPASDLHLAELLALQDPLVFVRLDPQSISRMNLPARSRFSYELTNWTEPYRWLAPSDQYFADDFNLYVANAVRPSTLLTEKVLPALSEIPSSLLALPAHALLRIEGDVAGRRLLSHHPLPVNESSAVLTNTVVAVRVDSAGEVFSTALIFGSGSPKADQQALAFASQARFEKVSQAAHGSSNSNNGDFTFGRFFFQWFPRVANATNQLNARP